MGKFEFDPEAIDNFVNSALTLRAGQMQALLDGVRDSEQGKDLSTVKAVLQARWQEEFERTLTDPHLSGWAEQLALGGRVIVEPKLTTRE